MIMSGIQARRCVYILELMYAPAACASAGVCTLLVDWAELALMFSIDSLYSLNLLCCFLIEAAVHISLATGAERLIGVDQQRKRTY